VRVSVSGGTASVYRGIVSQSAAKPREFWETDGEAGSSSSTYVRAAKEGKRRPSTEPWCNARPNLDRRADLPCDFLGAAARFRKSFSWMGSSFIRGRVLANRRFPCAPCSNRGNRQAGRLAAQKGRWWADRNPNKSQVFPVKEPNGSRIPPARFSLPDGNFCNASGSSNRVPERTPDQQR
jgi:hypothetical protein